jgi:virulence factor Mce-like protein
MITPRVIANLVAFFAFSVAIVAYGAVTLFGNPLRQPRQVVAELPHAGGLRTGFSASHDGVVVGTVSRLELHGDGVRVTVDLDPGATVPDGVEAKVVRASAVGEQRLELTSTATPGAVLPHRAVVSAAAEPLPPDVADVLEVVNDFFGALPAEELNTVVHELAVGIEGRAGDLRSINRSLTLISDDLLEVEPELRALLDAGPEVLDDFSDMSPAAHRALENTEVLTAILAERDEDIVRLLADGADLATIFDRVLADNQANLTCLTSDFATINAALQGPTLRALDRGLEINRLFFGAVEDVAVRGHSADVGYGPAQDDALWLRTRLLVPNEEPAASRYVPPRPPRPVETGVPCVDRTTSSSPGPAGGTPGDDRLVGASPPSSREDRASGPPVIPGAEGRDATKAPGGEGGPRNLIPLIALGAAVLAALAAAPAWKHRRRTP